MIVKISRSKKPFWGITKKIIEYSFNNYDEILLVLLTSKNKVYCFNEFEIKDNIENGIWGYREKDDNYKINVPLPRDNKFNNIKSFLDKYFLSDIIIAEEVKEHDIFYEGSVKSIQINSYERNKKARLKCISEYGYNCQICGFNFKDKYGDIGKNYIHIHHIKPLSEISKEYELDPLKDLIPICPNCHAMIHKKDPPFSVKEIKSKLKTA